MNWVRALVSGFIARVVGATTVMLALDGPGMAVHPAYPALQSMSTMARFPWVWTCVRAIAGDLAGLPLYAFRLERLPNGKTRRVLVDDAGLMLLNNPGGGRTGYIFRKQLYADWSVTGNAFVWRPSPVEAIRLHPAHVEPRTAGLLGGPIIEYRVWNGEKHISVLPSQMVHIPDISWSDDASSLLGETPIRCLHDDLTMELGAKELAAHQAQKGRPEILLSTEGQLGPEGAKELVGRWEQATKARHGAFATGRGVKATPLGWSPREFEFSERSAVARDVVMAVFEVPPARAGVGGASSYGTDKSQMRVYWEALRRKARAFDDAFTAAFATPGVRIEHDFTEVEALQVSYTERLMRVATWVGLGANPKEAAEYEGFDEAPVPEEVGDFSSPRPIDRQPEEPQDDRDKSLRLQAALMAYLGTAAPVYEQLAEVARAGADVTLALRIETERLFQALDDHVHTVDARWWAEELTAQTLEAVRIADPEVEVRHLEAFSPARAGRLAERIKRREAA